VNVAANVSRLVQEEVQLVQLALLPFFAFIR
jgi:hypothetical protein